MHDLAQSRQLRILKLLHAAEIAGITPMPILRLHAFAFLANILSPVWNLQPQEAKILKKRGGPFYPELQTELDHLVARGLCKISGLNYAVNEENKWRLEGAYALNFDLAGPVLEAAESFADERLITRFFTEIAYALASLSDADFDKAMVEDATYSDQRTSDGFVVDFGEYKDARKSNFSTNAANYFERLMPGGLHVSPGEKLQLYVKYLERRAHGG